MGEFVAAQTGSDRMRNAVVFLVGVLVASRCATGGHDFRISACRIGKTVAAEIASLGEVDLVRAGKSLLIEFAGGAGKTHRPSAAADRGGVRLAAVHDARIVERALVGLKFDVNLTVVVALLFFDFGAEDARCRIDPPKDYAAMSLSAASP